MNTFKQSLLYNLEKDVALLILDKLEYENLTFERASLIAKFVLAHLPENISDEELETILPSLDGEFFEIAGIVHKYMNKYEEKYEQKIKDDVHELMKSGQLDEASQLMKVYFHKKLPKQ